MFNSSFYRKLNVITFPKKKKIKCLKIEEATGTSTFNLYVADALERVS